MQINQTRNMNTPIYSEALRSDDVTAIRNSNLLLTENNSVSIDHEIGVFGSHRDVMVAIEELLEAGFDLNHITLVASKVKHYSWIDGLTIYDSFPEELFSANDIDWHFFQRLFRRGKYFVIVAAQNDSKKLAGTIMGRRKGHGKVWYVQNNS